MKHTHLTITGAVALAIFGTFIMTGQSSAQTVLPDGTVCPQGMICQKIPVACPAGFYCAPTNTSASVSESSGTSGYVPGLYYNGLVKPETVAQSISEGQAVMSPVGATQTAVTVGQNTSSTAINSGLDTYVPLATSDPKIIYVAPTDIVGDTAAQKKVRLETLSIVRSITSPYSNSDWKRLSTSESDETWMKDHRSVSMSNFCKYPITDNDAIVLKKLLASKGINAEFLTGPSTMYVDWGASGGGLDLLKAAIAARIQPAGTVPDFNYPAVYFNRCLDAGYVSNYPAYIINFTKFVNSHRSPTTVMKFGETILGGKIIPAPNYQ